MKHHAPRPHAYKAHCTVSPVPSWTQPNSTRYRTLFAFFIGPQALLRSVFRILKPYFWPKGCVPRLRVASTWVFLGISKAANIASPLMVSLAVQQLTAGNGVPYFYIILFTGLTFVSKAAKECQSLVYLKVKQTAFAQVLCGLPRSTLQCISRHTAAPLHNETPWCTWCRHVGHKLLIFFCCRLPAFFFLSISRRWTNNLEMLWHAIDVNRHLSATLNEVLHHGSSM